MVAHAATGIRTPRSWAHLGGEIAPYVIVDVPGWPDRRPLEVRDSSGRVELDTFGAQGQAGPPVTVSFDRRGEHYSPLIAGAKTSIPGDGDCFYRATLLALGDQDRAHLYSTMNLRGSAVDAIAIRALRQAVADQLEKMPDRYLPTLEMLELAHFESPPRRPASPTEEWVIIEPEDDWVMVNTPTDGPPTP